MSQTSVLMMDLDAGQSITIGGAAKITIQEKTGRRARLKIEAERNVKVRRLNSGHVAQKTNPKLKRAGIGGSHG